MADWGITTRAIHHGSDPDPTSGAVVPPISLSTTFAQHEPGKPFGKWMYSRSGNPSRDALETCLASVERGGTAALTFSSGLAATDTVMRLVPGDAKVVAVDDVYGGTRRLCSRVLDSDQQETSRFSFVDLSTDAVLTSALTPDTAIVWIESPTNPTMKLVDVKRVVAASRSQCPNALVVVDNTFLSPAGMSPLHLGADLVVHSATKYLNGHSDVLMGVVVVGATSNASKVADRLRFLQNACGAVPSPFDCYLCQRGLRTLGIRFDAHCRNALAVARTLEASPKVSKVAYPGLPSHPQHSLAKEQQHGFGGMITVWLRFQDTPPPQQSESSKSGAAAAAAGGEAGASGGGGGVDNNGGSSGGSEGGGGGGVVESLDNANPGLVASTAFMTTLKLFTLAESLGGVESLAELPSIMTHASVPRHEREALGISDAMVRLSVGIEDEADLIADVLQALEAVP